MYSRPYSDDKDAQDADSTSEGAGPEYVFEGFTIELNQKIGLTPPSTQPAASGQVNR